MNDKEIINAITNKNEKVLFDFYKKNKKELFYFIKRSIKDDFDVEELVQDTFLSFIESLRDFRFQSSLKTFLFAIGKRKIIDKIRRKKIKKILFSFLPEKFIDTLGHIILDDEIDKKILMSKLDNVFSSLPNDYSLVLQLKYKDGYKVEEIAKKINLNFKATESLIFRARKAFIKVYQNHEGQKLSFFKEKS